MLTSELLRRTADLHSQASSIEQNQALSLAQVDRVTSSLPDQLSLLELKLDELTKEALVLRSLSLDSGSTIELTSKAVRHLLKGKDRLLVQRSGKKPEALALEGPSSLSEEELFVEGALAETPQGSLASTDQRIWVPSALELSTDKVALSRATSTSGSASSESVDSDSEEPGAFDWVSEETQARVTVLSRAARAEDAVSHARLDRESVLQDSETRYINRSGHDLLRGRF